MSRGNSNFQWENYSYIYLEYSKCWPYFLNQFDMDLQFRVISLKCTVRYPISTDTNIDAFVMGQKWSIVKIANGIIHPASGKSLSHIYLDTFRVNFLTIRGWKQVPSGSWPKMAKLSIGTLPKGSCENWVDPIIIACDIKFVRQIGSLKTWKFTRDTDRNLRQV